MSDLQIAAADNEMRRDKYHGYYVAVLLKLLDQAEFAGRRCFGLEDWDIELLRDSLGFFEGVSRQLVKFTSVSKADIPAAKAQ